MCDGGSGTPDADALFTVAHVSNSTTPIPIADILSTRSNCLLGKAQHIVYNFEDLSVEKPQCIHDCIMAKPDERCTEAEQKRIDAVNCMKSWFTAMQDAL